MRGLDDYAVKIARRHRFETHGIQDLADNIDALLEATAGHPLRIRVTVQIGENGRVGRGVSDNVNVVLARVKAGWKAR